MQGEGASAACARSSKLLRDRALSSCWNEQNLSAPVARFPGVPRHVRRGCCAIPFIVVLISA